LLWSLPDLFLKLPENSRYAIFWCVLTLDIYVSVFGTTSPGNPNSTAVPISPRSLFFLSSVWELSSGGFLVRMEQSIWDWLQGPRFLLPSWGIFQSVQLCLRSRLVTAATWVDHRSRAVGLLSTVFTLSHDKALNGSFDSVAK
jgi:hypothetical protein